MLLVKEKRSTLKC